MFLAGERGRGSVAEPSPKQASREVSWSAGSPAVEPGQKRHEHPCGRWIQMPSH